MRRQSVFDVPETVGFTRRPTRAETERLKDPAAQLRLLTIAVESGRQDAILHSLRTLAHVRGMTAVARDAGVQRGALYRALGEFGNPKLETFLSIVHALGVRLRLEPIGMMTDKHY